MNIPAYLWLIGLPLLSSPLVYLSNHLGHDLRRWRAPQIIGGMVLLSAWWPFTLAVRDLTLGKSETFTIGSLSLCADGLSLLLAAVTLVLGISVTIFSGPYLSKETGQEKYYAMLLAIIGVMIGLGCACDLFNLWIWFEAMAISSYLLVSFYHDQSLSLEAGIKYLVQSAVGSVFVLLGIAMVFAQTGSLNLVEIRTASNLSPILLTAGILMVIGFGVKAALVPLHTWLPDAHSQAPSGISAMLSGVVIEAGLIAMLRSLATLAAITTLWGPLLMGFGCLNMLIGNLMALRQSQVKRLLAYSSITHVGYMLVGIGITIYAGGVNGSQGGVFHLFNHGMMKGLAFLAAGTLLYTLHIALGDHSPLTVQDLSGAARRYPLAALAFSLAVLGLGGIPPLSGFMSKWQIITAGFETHEQWIIIIVIFAALNSVFSLAYYAPMVNVLYRQEQSEVVRAGQRIPLTMNLPLLGLSAIILAIGIWPNLISWLTQPAGIALLIAFGK